MCLSSFTHSLTQSTVSFFYFFITPLATTLSPSLFLFFTVPSIFSYFQNVEPVLHQQYLFFFLLLFFFLVLLFLIFFICLL